MAGRARGRLLSGLDHRRTLDLSPEVARLFERLDADAALPGTELSAPWELIVRASG